MEVQFGSVDFERLIRGLITQKTAMEENHVVKNKKHYADMNNMRLAGQLCDVTIKVNDWEFQAHKIVLAANLSYFKLMFLNGGFQENKENVVTMKNLEEKCLELFLTYAYTGQFLLTKSNALGVLEVANYLSEDFIKQECIDFLEKHLGKSDALQAYHFANAIECIPLKTIAKSRILSNFEYCSQTAEYFDYDCDNLKNILSDVNLYPESQQNFFEGIIRWITYNVEIRKDYVKDLLSLIDMSKLAPDYIIEYFCRITKEQSDIATDIMFIYHEKIKKPTNLNQSLNNLNQCLMLMGFVNASKLSMQFYDFTEQEWGQPYEFVDLKGLFVDKWAILHNQFYYTTCDYDTFHTAITNLQVLDPSKKEHKMLASDRRLLRQSAMCACTETLYFCGGKQAYGNGNNDASDQVLRYDPRKIRGFRGRYHFETLPPMRNKRESAAAIFYQGYILVLGGYNEKEIALKSVEKYDPVKNQWQSFPSMKEHRGEFGVALVNESLYACGGGDAVGCIEVYDSSINRWRLVITDNEQMFDPIIIGYEGQLLFIESIYSNKRVRVYNPSKNQWQIDQKMTSGLQLCNFGGGLVSTTGMN